MADDQTTDEFGQTPEPAVDPVEAPVEETPAQELSAAAKARAARPVKKPVEAKKGHATPKRDVVVASKTAPVAKRTTPAQFVRQSVAELRKVVWPTGAQLSQYFIVVLSFVLFIMTIVVLLDGGLGWLLIKLLG